MSNLCRVQGWDLSLNHAAVVNLVDGELERVYVVTDVVAVVKKARSEDVVLINKYKKLDRCSKEIAKLCWWDVWIRNLFDSVDPGFVQYYGLEDYATSKIMYAYQIGELGGIPRREWWNRGCKFRLHDPMSVKMFATHKGDAEKSEMIAAVRDRWKQDFTSYDPPRSNPTKSSPKGSQNTQTSEDISDAYTVAKLVWEETRLRRGIVRLSDYHPKEIQMFNRATKAWPVNILGRDWTHNSTL